MKLLAYTVVCLFFFIQVFTVGTFNPTKWDWSLKVLAASLLIFSVKIVWDRIKPKKISNTAMLDDAHYFNGYKPVKKYSIKHEKYLQHKYWDKYGDGK